MKRIASFLLCILLLTYLVGVHFFYWSDLTDARISSSNLIRTNKIAVDHKAVFYLSSEQFSALVWTEGKKEFTLNNHRFDIMDINYLQGQIKITCYSDEKENQLVNAFTDFVGKFVAANSSPKNSKNNFSIQKDYFQQEFKALNISTASVLVYFEIENCFTPMTFISDSWNPPKEVA